MSVKITGERRERKKEKKKKREEEKKREGKEMAADKPFYLDNAKPIFRVFLFPLFLRFFL